MRRASVFLFLIVLFITSTTALAQDKTSLARSFFTEAADAYKNGRYEEAIRLNEKVLGLGLESPALYYNLGNSYFRSRKLGKAIVNYLRAQALAPRDSDIHANLGFARSWVENYLPE
ncbi:MAG: tetratricopeptide repeat protein, partial [Candidatus Omnitrophica bacterium]|nr:tetratricopeptide repeat protein [Candidatus Omnitrophota bacterium]